MSLNINKRKLAKFQSSNGTDKSRSQDALSSIKTDKSMKSKPGKQRTEAEAEKIFHRRTAFERCLSMFKYVFVVLLIPPFLNYAALLQEDTGLLPPGAQYDIGFGQKMFLSCNGTGLPTVILDAPTGMSSDVWNLVYEQTIKLTKACVYDRAGLGFSSRPFRNGSREAEMQARDKWKPFTVERMVDDLHALITFSSQQPRPLILVGAEMGSLVARFYAQVYEGDVADVLLIDPLTEDLFTEDSDVWPEFWWHHLVPSWQAMHLSAAFGLSRLALMIGSFETPLPKDESVPDAVTRRQKHLLCNPRHVSSHVDELYFINETFSQMQTLFRMKSFPSSVGVSVISSSTYDTQLPSNLNEAWMKSQQNLVSRLHPNAEHQFADNVDRNTIYWHQSELIVERIRQLVHRFRTNSSHSEAS